LLFECDKILEHFQIDWNRFAIQPA
jgi:hypothetical protein